MRKIFLAALLLLCLMSSAHAKPRLTVRTFDDRTEQHNAPSYAIMDMMVTELDKAGIFDLLERERLDLLQDEFQLAATGMLDPATAPKPGNVIGVQYTMTGAITMYYYDEKGKGLTISKVGGVTKRKTAYVVLDLRIFDQTSKIVYSAVQAGTATRAMSGFFADYSGFSVGIYKKQEGGILAAAARDAIIKHVAEIQKAKWE